MDDLAQQLGFKYETVKASIDEEAIGDRGKNPADLVALLARAKADAIIGKYPQLSGYLITCDQVVVHDGIILEKPKSTQEAEKCISGYSNSFCQTVGSVLCTNLANGQQAGDVDTTEVHFGRIPTACVETLVSEDLTYKCAGGLMIEHPLVTPLISRIVGTEDSVRGLSKHLVKTLLLRVAGP